MKWCAKCRRWTVGDKLHSTDEHKRGGKTQDGALKLGAAALEVVKEEEVKERDTDGALKCVAANIEDGGDDFLHMASGFLMAAKTQKQLTVRNFKQTMMKCAIELGKGQARRN
jgi:hypothetical protein